MAQIPTLRNRLEMMPLLPIPYSLLLVYLVYVEWTVKNIILVILTDKPKLLSVTPGDTTVTEFEDVSLGAVVEGNPAPYVAWVSQKGSVLQNQTEQFNYTISKITRRDGGKYQCIAKNHLGSRTSEFEINVSYRKSLLICWREFVSKKFLSFFLNEVQQNAKFRLRYSTE